MTHIAEKNLLIKVGRRSDLALWLWFLELHAADESACTDVVSLVRHHRIVLTLNPGAMR